MWNAIPIKISQTGGRSVYKRIGYDWGWSIVCPKLKVRQLREWLLHRCPDFSQLRTCNIFEGDLTYAIAVLECSNDVIHARRWVVTAVNEQRQRWPDLQCVSRRSFAR